MNRDLVEIRNDALNKTAHVAPSRTKHLGEGWYVVGAPKTPAPAPKITLRPGIEAENPHTVGEPQASSSPATPDTPEEK